MNDIGFLRKLALAALIFPLLILLGVSLATPLNFSTIALVGMIFCALLLPIFLQWHHALLILLWNATLNTFFLPGQPDAWMALAFASIAISVLKTTLNRSERLIPAPTLWKPMLFFAAVVIGIALTSGGFGLRALGSQSYGGRKYVAIIMAIVGFFALTWQRIPRERAMFFASLFFLSGITAVLSDLVYAAGPAFHFLFNLFPASIARLQATGDTSFYSTVFRIEGLAWASVAFFCFMLCRYGIRGIFDLRHSWRLFSILAFTFVGLLGGFRSRIAFIVLLFVVQFFLERLHRTKLLPILLGFVLVASALILPFSDKLPQPVQRCLSFLPVKVDPSVREDARVSTEWRLEMWRVLLPEIPKYFWTGKGYGISPTELYLAQHAERLGLLKNYESFIVTGSYHNGPLSVIIPLGVLGAVAFVWLLGAGWRVLYQNYRFGDPELRRINTFLLSFFTVKAVFFLTLAGALEFDLFALTGVLGLSVSVNAGVRMKTQSHPIKLPERLPVHA